MSKTITLPDCAAPVTAQQLVAFTGIEAEARGLAAHGLPPRDQDHPSKAEAAAIEIITGRIDKRHHDLDTQAHTIRSMLADIPDPRTDGTADTLHAVVGAAIMATFQTLSGTIRSTVEVERAGRSEYAAFRHKHGQLERSASYPLSKIRHFGIIGALVLIESIANAAMYLGTTGAGWAGALLTAFAVSVANVAISTAAGIAPCRALHLHDLPPLQPNRQRNTRLWAIPALIVAALAIVFINAYASHYRMVGTTSTTDDFTDLQVLHHLGSAPFDLSLAAYGLFAFGMLCALAAAWKGYRSSDKYFGYEHADRSYRAKAEDRDDLKAHIHGALDAVRQVEIDGVFNRAIATKAMLDDIRKRHTALQIAEPRSRKLDASDIAAAHAAITRFQALNRDIRSDGVVPTYFDTPADLSLLVPEPTHDDLAALIEAATEANVAHTEKLLKVIARQLERIDRAKDRTDQAMAVIERSTVAEHDLPKLSDLRRLIDDDQPHDATPQLVPA